LEVVLPFILRSFNAYRAGKTTLKEAVHGETEEEKPLKSQQDVEVRFLDKVERELALPEYSLFSERALTT
jgi:anoctamin-10